MPRPPSLNIEEQLGEDKLDATAAGGGHAAARALEERLARIEETLRDVAATSRP